MKRRWYQSATIALVFPAALAACYSSSTPPADVPAESSDTPTDSSDGSADGSEVDGGSCIGTPVPCSSFYTSHPCQSEYGCVWSYHDLICAGTAWPCETVSTRPDTCARQAGSRWE